MWSVGIVLHLLLLGCFPFRAKTQEETINLILNASLNFKGTPKLSVDDGWKEVSDEAKRLVRKLLSCEPEERPTASEVLNCSWIQRHSAPKSPSSRVLSASLKRLKDFKTQMTLQKAVLAYIASQELSKEEEKRIKEIFELIDIDKNGSISKKELVDGYLSLRFGRSEAEIKAQEIMNRIDINQNGIIDYNEFLMANIAASTILTKDRLRKAFNFFDSVLYKN
eukprot:TRINITY_DN8836_c0_g2_i4.p2 TRINITY_DN8836_c0_g2~~TRINITY_DN8836_c0_g2_i4.p2  ORF type:complete len:223 (+),score=65.80 TRINITY_DN8836_c0_g2_i4:1101-1769(+)